MDYSELMQERLEVSNAIDIRKANQYLALDPELNKKVINDLRQQLRIIDEDLRVKFPEHQVSL